MTDHCSLPWLKTLISDALAFGRLWYAEPDAVSNVVGYAKFYSRSRYCVIRVCDDAGNVIATHEQKGEFKDPWTVLFLSLQALVRYQARARSTCWHQL
jgi:hypothetical protein